MNKLKVAIDKFKNEYPCTSCGSCCKKVDLAISNIKELSISYNIDIELLSFPYKYDETGKCEKLNDENKCNVYENRPLICNIDKFIEIAKIDKNKFYELSIKSCNQLIDKNKLDKKYKIVVI